jgi:hypothetical protein
MAGRSHASLLRTFRAFTERSEFLTFQKWFATQKPRKNCEICIGANHAPRIAVNAWIEVAGT